MSAKSLLLGGSLNHPAKEGLARPKKFQTAFCEAYHCSPEQFRDKLFATAVFSHARIPAIILRALRPGYFEIEEEFIRDVGETEHPAMFRGEIDIYYGNNLRTRSWLRNKLLIRLSGSKMKRVGERVFGTPIR